MPKDNAVNVKGPARLCLPDFCSTNIENTLGIGNTAQRNLRSAHNPSVRNGKLSHASRGPENRGAIIGQEINRRLPENNITIISGDFQR
ncbi:hypothetical protein AVM02_16885 [Brucella anthropi]